MRRHEAFTLVVETVGDLADLADRVVSPRHVCDGVSDFGGEATEQKSRGSWSRRDGVPGLVVQPHRVQDMDAVQ
jgi:hypothetical protein